MKRTAKIVIHFGAGVSECYDTHMQERVDMLKMNVQQKGEVAASCAFIAGIREQRQQQQAQMQFMA